MLKDVVFAVRTLVGRPAFTFAAVATLAVGIGATTAIFSTVNAALLRPLPFPNSEDLYDLGTGLSDGRFSTGLVAPSEMFALNESAPAVVKATIVRTGDTILSGDANAPAAEPVQTIVCAVSEGFFELFGLPMTLGSAFSPEHHVPVAVRVVPGSPPPQMPTQVAVISYGVWQDQFGRDPSVVGKYVQLAFGRSLIVGVAHRDFDIPKGTSVWTNLITTRASVAHSFEGYMRVRPGTTRERLHGELTATMEGVAREFPASATGRVYVATPLVEAIVGDLGPILILVLGGAGLLLLLACANVTNLLLARSTARAREIAVRTALGAPRGRIVRQLLTESLVLAFAGTLAGLFVAFAGVRLLLYLGASELPRLQAVPFDVRVLLFALAALVVTGLLIGMAPALRLARTDLRALLNESGRSATGGRGAQRMFAGMIVAEIAVAITLVVGAGWLVRSFANLSAADTGFTAEGRLIFELFLPPARYGRANAMAALQTQLAERLQAIGSVTAVGTTSVAPLRPERNVAMYVGMRGEVDDPNHQLTARLRMAGPGFFKAMGVKVIAGREFTADDRQLVPNVIVSNAIVNRAFVDRYLAGRDPLREQFYMGFPTVDRRRGYTIMGVVDDMKYVSVAEPAEPTFYFPAAGLQQTVVVASSLADPRSIAASVRAAVKEIDPTIPVEPISMADIVSESLSRQRLGVTLMLLFAGAALLLAAIGIYGVIAYASAQRVGEVATRMALGATPSHVFWMLMYQGRTLSLIGAALGLAAAYASGRIVANRLYEVRASDPVILMSAVILVFAIALVAVLIPARRASQIDLARTLRLE